MKKSLQICLIIGMITMLDAKIIYGVGAKSCAQYIDVYKDKDVNNTNGFVMVQWTSWAMGYISGSKKEFKQFENEGLMLDIKNECEANPLMYFMEATEKSMKKIEVRTPR